MRCREFHRLLAEWTRGRLESHDESRMNLHASECRACGEEAELERSLRQSFITAAKITRTPDLWERIEARVEQAPQQRFGFVFRFQRSLALGGAMAAGVALAFVIWRAPSGVVIPSQDVPPGELAAIEKLAEIRMPEMGGYTETPMSGDAAHALLVSR